MMKRALVLLVILSMLPFGFAAASVTEYYMNDILNPPAMLGRTE